MRSSSVGITQAEILDASLPIRPSLAMLRAAFSPNPDKRWLGRRGLRGAERAVRRGRLGHGAPNGPNTPFSPSAPRSGLMQV
jgi:hypothetical protein